MNEKYMTTSMSKLKILGVIDEEPFDYRTWSGTSRYFFSSLRNRGILFDAIHAQPSNLTSTLYKALSFCLKMDRWKFKYHLNIKYFKQRTDVVLKKIKDFNDKDYNVILQVGAWYDLPKKTDKITVSYHDGNLYTLVNNSKNRSLSNLKFVKKCMGYERDLYKRMDLIFPMSEWLANSFCNGFGVKRDKVVPVGAGINLPYIKEIKGKSYDEPRILFVGKMFERKGGKYLLEAFKFVKKEIPAATLTIIGPELQDLPDGVSCLGFVSKNSEEGIKQLLNEYSKATVFVMPSLYEPFGIVFAEAMAHKLPCIGTNTCAMPEIITDKKSGFIVPVGNSKILARRMTEILKEHEMAKVMGYYGYKNYKEKFTWDKVTGKIEAQIKKTYFS